MSKEALGEEMKLKKMMEDLNKINKGTDNLLTIIVRNGLSSESAKGPAKSRPDKTDRDLNETVSDENIENIQNFKYLTIFFLVMVIRLSKQILWSTMIILKLLHKCRKLELSLIFKYI
jgi:hypothetical protein